MKETILICVQCNNQFSLSSEEYEKLHSRGFALPKRCPACRKNKSKNVSEVNEDWGHKRRKRHGRGSEKYFDADES